MVDVCKGTIPSSINQYNSYSMKYITESRRSYNLSKIIATVEQAYNVNIQVSIMTEWK